MQFLLQTGSGMMEMNLDLLYNFNDLKNTGVIISPRAIPTRAQVEKHARDLKKRGCSRFFDPCFYNPRSVRQNFYEYPYWDTINYTTTDFLGREGKDFCYRVMEYQASTLQTTAIILPGSYTNTLDDPWLEMHRLFAETAAAFASNLPTYATIALGPDIILSNQSLDRVLDHVTNYPVTGVYLVYETPNKEHLPTNSQFLSHLLSACLTLTLAQKEIIIGYTNQYALMFAAAGVERIASGNWRNARQFHIQTFDENESIPIAPKNWYYDGQSLSEFLPDMLNIAYQDKGMQGLFGPPTPFIADLLTTEEPSKYPLQQNNSFKHYLATLRKQWLQFNAIPVQERWLTVSEFFTGVNNYLIDYESYGFNLGRRSFISCYQAVEYALTGFMNDEADRILML